MKLSWRYIATKTCNIHEGDDERVEISEEEDVTDKQVQSYISKLQTYVQKKPKNFLQTCRKLSFLLIIFLQLTFQGLVYYVIYSLE